MRRILLALAALTLAVGNAPAAQNDASSKPIQLLFITGDNVGGHDWRATTRVLREVLGAREDIHMDVTATPSKDLTPENLKKYNVLVLNYKDTPQGSPESQWSDANKEAFLNAVKGGTGLVVLHYASAAFTKPNWEEFEKAIAGGWRSQGYHGPKHEYTVKKTEVAHPISRDLPAKFDHAIDELYQNSLLTPGSVVLATAYSDPDKPRGTGKDEPVVWINHYGKGRVYNNTLGHDPTAIADENYQKWLLRGIEWAATGDVKDAK